MFEFLLIAIAFLILCPTRWDPAIKIKEWTLRKRKGSDKH